MNSNSLDYNIGIAPGNTPSTKKQVFRGYGRWRDGTLIQLEKGDNGDRVKQSAKSSKEETAPPSSCVLSQCHPNNNSNDSLLSSLSPNSPLTLSASSLNFRSVDKDNDDTSSTSNIQRGDNGVTKTVSQRLTSSGCFLASIFRKKKCQFLSSDAKGIDASFMSMDVSFSMKERVKNFHSKNVKCGNGDEDALWMHDESARTSRENTCSNSNYSDSDEYEAAKSSDRPKSGRPDLRVWKSQESADSGLDGASIDVSWLSQDRNVRKMDVNERTMTGPHPDDEQYEQGISLSPMILQELSALTVSQTSVSNANAMKTEEVSKLTSTSKLFLLNPDETENLRFPPGTVVWWNQETNTSKKEHTYREGTVGAVFFDCTSQELLYGVKCKGEVIFSVENDLGFAPPCPIFLTPVFGTKFQFGCNEIDQGPDHLLIGNALLCKRVGGDWVYTVSVEDKGSIKLLENVPSCYVSYRKI